MAYIDKRKTIGLIANEYFGIETCKVDDIISLIETMPEEPVEKKIDNSIGNETCNHQWSYLISDSEVYRCRICGKTKKVIY